MLIVSRIELGDDIRWTTKELSQEDFSTLKRTFLPVGTLVSVWESSKVLFAAQTHRLREIFWSDSSNDAGGARSSDSAMQQVLNLWENTTGPGPIKPAIQPVKSDMQRSVAKTGLPHTPGNSPQEIHDQTIATFVRTFRRSMSKQPVVVTKGSVILSGLIEGIGAKGRVTLDVTAAYNLKTEQFSGLTVSVRSFARFSTAKQRAKVNPGTS